MSCVGIIPGARHDTRSRMSVNTTGAFQLRNSQTAFALLVLLSTTIALCQGTPIESLPQESQPAAQTQTQTHPLAQPQSPTPPTPQKYPEAPSSVIIDPSAETLHQTHRIMGVLPNFTAVDSNTHLPRLSTAEKFNMALHDSVDYSSLLLVAGLAGKGLYSNSIPALGTGGRGFGRASCEESRARAAFWFLARFSSPRTSVAIVVCSLSAERWKFRLRSRLVA